MGMLICLCLISLSLSGSGEEATAPSETVTIVDSTGQSVDVSRPVERIVSITSPASEIICALGAGDRIVGRSSYSIFPPYLEDVPVVGKSSYTPNIELILELEPDVVIADGMLSDDNREKIETAGIPVMVEGIRDPARITSFVTNLGLILDKEERTEELITFIEQYQTIIQERTADLEPEDKPVVFYEYIKPYRTASCETSIHNHITAAGGMNIAGAEPVPYPTMSSEWVVERDPEVIIRHCVSRGDLTTAAMKEMRDEIFSRPGLSGVRAVENDRVYLITNYALDGLRSVVGELYLAKWFHPALFEDIDPEAVHRDLVQKFYGLELEGVYAYS
ncbi:MAG: ABC transporter substrate-binding protein [Methanotrichaceae archaeon]